MSSLIPVFLSNLEQLELNQLPVTNAGKFKLRWPIIGKPFRKLRYKGEKYEKLSDEDVKKLCDALKHNTTFEGEINLSRNNLTDLSGLYIGSVMKTFAGIRKLDLSCNDLKSKSGEYIGDVLINNPDYRLEELSFKGNRLEECGLRRIIVAATKNRNLRKLKLGVISDFGLSLLSQELLNTNLVKLDFEEDKENPFSDKVRDQFIEAFKEGIENSEDFTIERIVCKDERIDYYCKIRKEQIKQAKKYKKRNKALAQKSLADKLIANVEGKKKPEKINIKKYFRNTFADLLNDAMYELTRKQEKFPDNDEYFTVEGACTFVGEFLLEHLPEHEKESLKAEKEHADESKREADDQD